MTAVISEKQFQKQVLDLAGYTGWTAYHTYDSRRSEPGFPDLVLANPKQKRVVYAELKAQRGRVSPDQRRWLDMLEACGAEVALWRPADMPVIEQVLKGQRIGGAS